LCVWQLRGITTEQGQRALEEAEMSGEDVLGMKPGLFVRMVGLALKGGHGMSAVPAVVVAEWLLEQRNRVIERQQHILQAPPSGHRGGSGGGGERLRELERQNEVLRRQLEELKTSRHELVPPAPQPPPAAVPHDAAAFDLATMAMEDVVEYEHQMHVHVFATNATMQLRWQVAERDRHIAELEGRLARNHRGGDSGSGGIPPSPPPVEIEPTPALETEPESESEATPVLSINEGSGPEPAPVVPPEVLVPPSGLVPSPPATPPVHVPEGTPHVRDRPLLQNIELPEPEPEPESELEPEPDDAVPASWEAERNGLLGRIASPDEILHWWPDAATADAATANATGPPVSDLARYRRANTIAHAIDLGSGPASDYLAMIERPQAEKAAQREAETKAARLAEEQSLSEELETLERHGRVDGR
jgi:hypothetical protein